MLVTNPNSIKIYNLSAGKSLPEWLSSKKRRSLEKKDVDVRRRIELIQDFEMPSFSTNVHITKDKQYIFATGMYKPRVRCYDTTELSMKFERCFDEEIVQFHILSEDYSKLVFLQADRHVEFHAQYGKYYRTRIPKYGRDLDYHAPNCDMYFVGASPEIYRLNLEQGRFVTSLQTKASELMCCQFNPVHCLFACGSKDGTVECWDPRVRTRVGNLNCAMDVHDDTLPAGSIPAVTALKFRDGLNIGIGTSTGHVLLYDMRSSKPLLVKDHQYGLPIKRLAFHDSMDLVLSMDKRILKIWNRHTGKAYTAIEGEHPLHDLCLIPDTGMIFMANDAPKILTHYIPAMGPAPKWCSFLDNLTEELEETENPTVYDDYKFVTRTELDNLGLTHLIGSSLLRAYMHGYFMDFRLYNKAKSIAEPFAYKEYRKSKIKEKIEQERTNRVKLQKLPKVNKDLAAKLLAQEKEEKSSKKKKEAGGLLKDGRFSALFTNPDFHIDTESEEYRLLNPVVSRADRSRQKRLQKEMLQEQFQQVEEADESEGRPSSDEDSSDDDREWVTEVKQQHRLIQQEGKRKRPMEDDKEETGAPRFYEVKSNKAAEHLQQPEMPKVKKKKTEKLSLGDRITQQEKDDTVVRQGPARGSMEMTFTFKKDKKKLRQQQQEKLHHAERRHLRRSAGDITRKLKQPPKFWMGKRVK